MYRLSTVIADDEKLGHVSEVAFHPDGTCFAVTVMEYAEVRLYDTETCELLRVYQGSEADLDSPHGLWMTPRHLIVCNRYVTEAPPSITVYRLDSESSAPVFDRKMPNDSLQGGHSISMHDDLMVVTCTQWFDSIGSVVSFRFNDETGEVSEALDICESPIQDLGRPKGVSFSADGSQVYVTFCVEKLATGWKHLGVNLRKAWDILLSQGMKGLYYKLKGRNAKKAGRDNSLHNGIVVFDIDGEGNFSGSPARVMLSEQFCRLEGITFYGDTVLVSDTINNRVHFYDHATDPELAKPVHTISENLSLPHGVKLSPDQHTLVITNYGLQTGKDVIHWDYPTQERTDNVQVYRRTA
jgi:WD40 repeat protein